MSTPLISGPLGIKALGMVNLIFFLDLALWAIDSAAAPVLAEPATRWALRLTLLVDILTVWWATIGGQDYQLFVFKKFKKKKKRKKFLFFSSLPHLAIVKITYRYGLVVGGGSLKKVEQMGVRPTSTNIIVGRPPHSHLCFSGQLKDRSAARSAEAWVPRAKPWPPEEHLIAPLERCALGSRGLPRPVRRTTKYFFLN